MHCQKPRIITKERKIRAHFEGASRSTQLAEVLVLLANDEFVHFYLAAIAQFEGEIAELGVVVPARRWQRHLCCVEVVVSRPMKKNRKTMGEVLALIKRLDALTEMFSRHHVKERMCVKADYLL
jgi:hypothetical protein